MRQRGGSTIIMMGKLMMQNGRAKKPRAPAPNRGAGTAMTVYAGDRSPPIRNQVIRVPKLRPARPHSSRLPRSDRRQRTAQKPAPVTSRKQAQKTERATGGRGEPNCAQRSGAP